MTCSLRWNEICSKIVALLLTDTDNEDAQRE